MQTNSNAAAAATFGGALGILIAAILGWFGLDVSTEVAGAISTVCAGVVVFFGALMRHVLSKTPLPIDDPEEPT